MKIQTPISTSIFELLKCGPGPSSSHTIAPMRAGYEFINLCKHVDLSQFPSHEYFIEVKLFGSLSATGVGHGSHSAIIAGLLGNEPSECPAALIQQITMREDNYHVQIQGKRVNFSLNKIIFSDIIHSFECNNTLECTLYTNDRTEVLSKRYYSVGGGFLQWDGYTAPERGKPYYPYSNMSELQNIFHETGLTFHEVILINEMELTGMSRPNILFNLKELISKMEQSVALGMSEEGLLPGTLGVERKARVLKERALQFSLSSDRFLANLNAHAFATSEQNASGGVIVTAPTCGASGVLPSLLYALKHDLRVGDRAVCEGMLASVAIGFLAKHNAAIAGAEVGCQGEIGVASAMGAALLAHSKGDSAIVVENAAEIALEHHLGLTCDPVGGYVQIPCIERNAMGALKAYNAYLLARTENPQSHRVRLDAAILAMNETGREMHTKFKETSLGGLAVSMVTC